MNSPYVRSGRGVGEIAAAVPAPRRAGLGATVAPGGNQRASLLGCRFDSAGVCIQTVLQPPGFSGGGGGQRQPITTLGGLRPVLSTIGPIQLVRGQTVDGRQPLQPGAKPLYPTNTGPRPGLSTGTSTPPGTFQPPLPLPGFTPPVAPPPPLPTPTTGGVRSTSAGSSGSGTVTTTFPSSDQFGVMVAPGPVELIADQIAPGMSNGKKLAIAGGVALALYLLVKK